MIAGSGTTAPTILTDYEEWIVLLAQLASETLQGKPISVTVVMVDKSDYPDALQSSAVIPDQAIVNAHIVQ